VNGRGIGEAPVPADAACPACGASQTGAPVAFVKDGWPIVRCPSCGLLRRENLPDDEEIAAVYGPDYFQPGAEGDPAGYLDYLADEGLHRLNARKRLGLTERFVPCGTLLDVGCAAGFFLDEARQRGWRVSGVDASEEMAAVARNTIGVDAQAIPFADVEVPRGSVDCVTMWDYIEHSRDPAGDLEKATALLRPGGLLALSTGDAGSLVARVAGRRWHLLTPRHHLFYFDRRTLRLLLENSGLTVLECKALASSYSLRHLAHKLRTAVDIGPLRWLDSAVSGSHFGGAAIPLDLGDIVTVLARKPL
jgi:SAM-dependent methyltransferase